MGATVRSIAHVQSLFLYSPSSAPGERPKFLGVKEQRITLLSMAVLLGISILLYQVLKVSLNSSLVSYMYVVSLYLSSAHTIGCSLWSLPLHWSYVLIWSASKSRVIVEHYFIFIIILISLSSGYLLYLCLININLMKNMSVTFRIVAFTLTLLFRFSCCSYCVCLRLSHRSV